MKRLIVILVVMGVYVTGFSQGFNSTPDPHLSVSKDSVAASITNEINVTETKWSSISTEELYTFWFAEDTMILAASDSVIAFSLKACANNTGRIWMEGKKKTVSGIESDQIYFEASETFNGGLLIQIQDSITIGSDASADTCIVSLILK